MHWSLSYPQLSAGPVNTTIGWTYSNLTCHPSVFIIQEYADRDADKPLFPNNCCTVSSHGTKFGQKGYVELV